jgi:hypothetical protein
MVPVPLALAVNVTELPGQMVESLAEMFTVACAELCLYPKKLSKKSTMQVLNLDGRIDISGVESNDMFNRLMI